MSKGSFIKTFGILAFIGFLLLFFFQNNILINLVDPIKSVFQNIISIFPVVLGLFAGVLFIVGILNRRRRWGYFILAGVCFGFSIFMINPSFLNDLSSMFSGNPLTPIGWH